MANNTKVNTPDIDWDRIENSKVNTPKVDTDSIDWDNLGDSTVQAREGIDGYGTAIKTGLLGQLGSNLALLDEAIVNFAKPSYKTDEEWKKHQGALHNFVQEKGKKLAKENAVTFEPWSGKAIAQGVAGVVPSAAVLAPATALAMRSGNANLLRGVGVQAANKLGFSPAQAVLAGEAAASVGSSIYATFPEAAMERESTRQEALSEGKSQKEAESIANAVGMMNVVLLTATNSAELFTMFGKVSHLMPKDSKKRFVGKMIAMFGEEAVEEGGQTVAPAIAKGEDVNWDEVGQAAVIGGLGGLVFGGAGMVAEHFAGDGQEAPAGDDDVKKTTDSVVAEPPLGSQPTSVSEGVKEPSVPNFNNIDTTQARSVINGYRDSLGAGEEYNALSDLLNSGSDDELVASAKKILEMQNKAVQEQNKVETPDEPQDVEVSNEVDVALSQPVEVKPEPVKEAKHPKQSKQQKKEKVKEPSEKQLLNMEQTLRRIAKNKVNGNNKVSDEVANRINTVLDNKDYNGMLGLAKELKLKRSKELQDYIKGLSTNQDAVVEPVIPTQPEVKDETGGKEDGNTLSPQGEIVEDSQNTSDNGKPQENEVTPPESKQDSKPETNQAEVDEYGRRLQLGEYKILEGATRDEKYHYYESDREGAPSIIIARNDDDTYRVVSTIGEDYYNSKHEVFESLEEAEDFVASGKRKKKSPLKLFRASVVDEDGKRSEMYRAYKTAEHFKSDLKGNGYKVVVLATADNFYKAEDKYKLKNEVKKAIRESDKRIKEKRLKQQSSEQTLDNPKIVSQNTGEHSVSTTEPDEVTSSDAVASDSWSQYVADNIDDPVIRALIDAEDEKAKNVPKQKKSKKSKEEVALEAQIKLAEVEEELTNEIDMPEDVDGYIEKLKAGAKSAVKKYFNQKTDRKKFVDEVANSVGLKVYIQGEGKNATYFVETKDKGMEKINKTEADAISAISGAEIQVREKEPTKAQIKEAEKANLIKEIPEESVDDFLETVDERFSQMYEDALFADSPIDGYETLGEAIAGASFDYLSSGNDETLWMVKDAVGKLKVVDKTSGREKKISDILDDAFIFLTDKYRPFVKSKTRNTTVDSELQLSRKDKIEILQKYVNKNEAAEVLDYIEKNNPLVDFGDLTSSQIKDYVKDFKDGNKTSDMDAMLADLQKDQEFLDSVNATNSLFENAKFKAENEDRLENFQPDLLGNLINVGRMVVSRYNPSRQTWDGQMLALFAKFKDRAQKLLNSVWEFLKKLPKELDFNLKTAIDSLALAGKYRNNNAFKNAVKNSDSPIKDYIDAAYASIKRYPRRNQDSVIELSQGNNEGGSNDVNVRVAGQAERSSNSGRAGEPMEVSSGTSDSGTQSQGERETVGGTSSIRGMGTGNQNVSGTGADSGRVQSNQQSIQEVADDSGRSAGNLDNRGSFSGGRGGTSVDATGGKSTTFENASVHQTPNETSGRELHRRNSGLVAQEKINNQKSVKVQAGDLANIAETLPVLYEGQHSDIRNAEKRLYVDNGKGMLVADGTGCGKTLVGLGLIKRANWQGKKNILVVVPTSDIAKAWHNDGKLLGYTDEDFADITTSGIVKNKINVITYASLYQNKDLLENKWGLILCDESHHLAAGENSSEESPAKAVSALRGITGHHNGFEGWFELRHKAEIEKRKELQVKIDKVVKLLKSGADLGGGGAEVRAEFSRLNKEHKVLDDKISKLRVTEKPLWEQHQQRVGGTRVLFLSATPFAYAQNVYLAEGYLFDYNDFGGSYRSMMVGRFGFHTTTSGKLKDPVAAGRMKNNNLNEWAFHNALIASGSMSKRSLEIDQDYNRQFIKVKAGVGADIDLGLRLLERYNSSNGLFDAVTGAFEYHQKKRLCEAIKAREAIPLIKDYLKQGKQVVLFHDTKVDTPLVNPFNLSDDVVANFTDEQKAAYNKFKQEHPELASLQLGDLKPPIETIKEAFGQDLMTINGATSKEDKRNAADVFQGKKPFDKSKDDITKGKLIMLTVDAGKEGISLHDTSEGGKIPRVLINLGMPTKPTDVIQLEGRIYRYGQTSNAQFRYLTTGTRMENQAFMERISRRSKTAENFALGEDARKLDLRLILGYMRAEAGGTEFSALNDTNDSGGKVDDRRSAEELSRELDALYGASGEYMRAKAQEIFNKELSGTEDFRQKMLTPENEIKFVATLKDSLATEKVVKVADGTWMATLANGQNLWIDLNTSQAAILDRMTAEQKQKMLDARAIKNSGFLIRGLFNKEKLNGEMISIIRLTEAAKEGTLDHEVFHFVLNVLATKKEKDFMLKYYLYQLKKSLGEKEYNAMPEQTRLDRAEEMAADDYAAFVKEDRKPHSVIRKLYWKAQKFLAKWLDNFGVNTPMGMYVKVREGEYFARKQVENTEAAERALAINKDVDLNQRVRVVDLTGKVPANANNSMLLKKYLQSLIDAQAKFTTADKKAVMSMLPKDVEHVTYSSDRYMRRKIRQLRSGSVFSIKELIEASVLIESIPNKKTDRKPRVKAYHRFYVPVRVGENVYTVRVVGEEQNDNIKFDPLETNLFDVIIERNRPTVPKSPNGLSVRTMDNGSFSTISIRDMLAGVKDYESQDYIKEPQPLQYEIQDDETVKFSAEPTDVVDNKMARDLIAGTLAEANALADQSGVEQGMLEVKVKDKTLLQKLGEAPLLEIIKSPSRMAEKYPVFKSFYKIFLKAQEVQEKLREQWNKRFNNALGLLKDEAQLNEYLDIMVAGEYEAKVYEVEELKEMGYSEKAIFAYRRTRKLIDDIWKAVNDAHRGLKEYTKVVNHKELKALKEDGFIENLMVQEAHSDTFVPAKDVKPILGMTYKVTYNKPKTYKGVKRLTREQLSELKSSPYAKVSNVKEVVDEAAGVKYFEATVEQTPAPIGKITGYLPHIFEQWMVYVNTEGGMKPIHSAKTLKDAVAEGEKILQANPKLAITVQPKLFKPDEFMGGVDSEHGKSLGLTMSDAEFTRLQLGLVANSNMTLAEAKGALKNVARRTSRNRFFGNIRHRKGRAGYNQDVIESLNRYMTMASRYCALQPAKSEAIPLYERTFKTAWDKDVPRDMPMARIIKDYVYYNNGTPNDWETRFNDWLNRWDWWKNNVSANYGDRSALVAIGKINGLVSVAKLGFFNVSSAIVNLSQLKSTYALVGENGIAQGIKAMGRMNRVDKRVIEETGVRYNIGLDTVSGFTKRRMAPNAGKAATAVQRLRNAYNAFADKSMVLFKTSEAYIRKLTVLSAYYKGIADGMSHKEAIEFAKDVNRKANFDYGAADAPAIFRKAAGTPLDLALLFKKYPVKELEMISTMLPLIGSGTKAQKARYWGMYFLMAGLFGFPAGDWVDELLESLLGYKPSVLAKAWMFKTLGDNKATRMMVYGAGAGLGVDVSKRVGMADMIPSEDNMLAYLTGATGSTLWQMANAIATGDAVKVAKAYSPALGHALEAAQGYRTTKDGGIAFRYEGLDRALKAAGFRPIEESVTNDIQSIKYANDTIYRNDRKQLVNELAMKLLKGEKLSDSDKARAKKLNVTMKNINDAKRKLTMTTQERFKETLSKRQKEELKGTPADKF